MDDTKAKIFLRTRFDIAVGPYADKQEKPVIRLSDFEGIDEFILKRRILEEIDERRIQITPR